MGSSRVRRPELDVLPISQGDTITVKRFLTAGEFRELIRAATKPVRLDAASAASGKDLAFEIDPTESGVATVLAYLVDWTFTDFNGRPLVIRDQPASVVRAMLDLIDADSYMEVQRAIQEHDTTVRAFAAAEKKMTSGATPLEPTLQSVG
jgi:hypothetical protein